MNSKIESNKSLGEDNGKIAKATSQLPNVTLQDSRIDQKVAKPKFSPSRVLIVKFWIVLILTTLFCAVLLVAAHVSHSLTLRVEAYHSLYNILSLIGCLLSMKLCNAGNSLKNTFGWARVELLSTLCTLIFLGSLCFGVAVDSIQTAAHAGHQDSMHHPVPIIALAGIGIFINTIVFLIIGGYTHHQGCQLERKNSIVWIKRPDLDTNNSNDPVIHEKPSKVKSYQGIRGTLRDINGLIIVMICASIVMWDEGQTLALYVDPVCAISSAALLLFLSYPYGKQCCHILLQTIPGHIDVQTFSGRLLRKFPQIVNVHHLHIWSLTPEKIVATAHVVFNNPGVYKKLSKELSQFFTEEEISKVTLQPEFVSLMENVPASKESSCQCLLQCKSNECEDKNSCPGCTEVTSINRNIEISPEINVINDSSTRMKSKSISDLKDSLDNSFLKNIRLKTQNYRSKGNSFTCILPNDNETDVPPCNNLFLNIEKNNFHSLQDISSLRPHSNSGRYGEYLAAFQKLRMKDITNSVEQL